MDNSVVSFLRSGICPTKAFRINVKPHSTSTFRCTDRARQRSNTFHVPCAWGPLVSPLQTKMCSNLIAVERPACMYHRSRHRRHIRGTKDAWKAFKRCTCMWRTSRASEHRLHSGSPMALWRHHARSWCLPRPDMRNESPWNVVNPVSRYMVLSQVANVNMFHGCTRHMK